MYNYFYQIVRPTNNIRTLKCIICFVKLCSHMYCAKGDGQLKIIPPIYHNILLILTMIFVSLISM